MASKILDAGAEAQTFEKMREDANGVLQRLTAKSVAAMNAAGSLAVCMNMVEQLDTYVKLLGDFVAERERLGEYDASAAAIIELSKVTLRMAEFNLVTLRAIVNFRLES